MTKNIRVGIIALLAFLNLIIVADDNSSPPKEELNAFQSAWHQDSVTAYRDFLQKHPNSQFKSLAESRLSKLSTGTSDSERGRNTRTALATERTKPVTTTDTTIHDAAKNGDLERIEALLKDKPDMVNNRDRYGATPLHWAVCNGDKAVVKLLLANKADVNARENHGRTPLHLATDKDVAELLLANKADVNAREDNGWTPLQEAAKWGYKDVAELLRRHDGHE